MIVRQADAHAWTEVWLDNRGWVRVDPTSAVSPARIEQGLDQAIPATENPRFLLRRNSKIFEQIGLIWDSVNNRWNEWVLGYGPEMQQLFLKYLGIQNTAAYNLVIILSLTLAVVMVVIALISLRKQHPSRRDDVQRIYMRLCRKLSRAGYTKRSYDGASSYLEKIRFHNSEFAANLSPIFETYVDLRYRQENTGTADIGKFRKMVEKLKPVSATR
jgi:hypothetical protein